MAYCDNEILWLYDRTIQDSLCYVTINVKRDAESESNLTELVGALKTKKGSLNTLDERSPTKLLGNRLSVVTDLAINRLISAGRYKAESSVPRQALDLIFNAFVRDKPRVLIVEGSKGSGRSTWCCMTSTLRQSSGLPVLLLSGAELINCAFPADLSRTIGLQGDFVNFALRQAELSPDGLFVIIIHDADPMALQSSAFISCLKWADTIGDLPIKVVLTATSSTLNLVRQAGQDWMAVPSIRHSFAPLMGETELLALADAIDNPSHPGTELARITRRELAGSLIRLMGRSLRPWLARLVLERADVDIFEGVFSAFDLYSELYKAEILNARHKGRGRILRELALHLHLDQSHALNIDRISQATERILGLLDAAAGEIRDLIDEGILVETIDTLDRRLSFSDDRFRDFLAALTLPLPEDSTYFADSMFTSPSNGEPTTVPAMVLIRSVRERREKSLSLFQEIGDELIQSTLLREIAVYDSEAFLTLFAPFFRHNPAQGCKFLEGLLDAEMPRIAAQAASLILPCSEFSDLWRVHVLLGLCKFAFDDYAGARKELQHLDISKSSRALNLLGEIEVAIGSYDDAETAYRQALAGQFTDYPQGRGHALRGLGYALFQSGKNSEAREVLNEACREMLGFGDSVNRAEALGDLGELLCAMGDLGASRVVLNESLAMNERLGRVGGAGIVEGLLAIVDWKEGLLIQSEARFSRALDLVRHACYRWREAWLLQHLGKLQASQERIEEANRNLKRSRDLFAVLKVPARP
jgi:tetratricopeptide (TPR) repeat protein